MITKTIYQVIKTSYLYGDKQNYTITNFEKESDRDIYFQQLVGQYSTESYKDCEFDEEGDFSCNSGEKWSYFIHKSNDELVISLK